MGEFVTAEETQRRIAAAGIRIPRQAKLEVPAKTSQDRRMTTLN